MSEEKIKEFERQIEELKRENEEIVKWDESKATIGNCHNCHGDDDVEKPVIYRGYKRYCQVHWADGSFVRDSIEKNMRRIKDLEEEIAFQKTLAKITRFNDKNLKEMIKGLRAILQHKEHKYDYKFTEEDKKAGMKVLMVLKKIAPPSSQFIDKGVCVNQNLILSGTMESGWRYESDIRLIALDQKEGYNAVARVGLTLKDAERLRGLLTECIEHVRILGWINRIKDKMGITIEDMGEDEE